MFRAIILPIFRRTRLCVTACGIMHSRCCRPATGRQICGCIIPQAVTHSLVFLKMCKIIVRNMLSWLALLISRIVASSWFSILFIFYYIFLTLAKQSQFIPLQNVVYFITLPFLFRKTFTFYINDVLLFKCPIQGPKGYILFFLQSLRLIFYYVIIFNLQRVAGLSRG
jgi:hypothetical protein